MILYTVNVSRAGAGVAIDGVDADRALAIAQALCEPGETATRAEPSYSASHGHLFDIEATS